ncbi:MAG: GbsR/MarR family transcriptional regulator [Bdellovibrionales bacterium]
MNECPKELNDFAEEIGGFIQYWGFKKVHGQIWTHIFLSEIPLDARALMDRLKISKALVSITLKDLVEYDVVREAGKGPNSTLVYEANTNVVQVILGVLRMREMKMLAQIEMAYGLLDNLNPEELANSKISSKRLKMMIDLIRKAKSQLQTILKLGTIDLKVWKKISSGESKSE